ncbi:subtilisin-like protease [Auriscalpium vulgare]|uniref:Subtilisin-like protease n=1 Tax=Auriscalpium vulgare TaxID=40419 RepID=A0ACB8RA26_9AGAM|nr:subtilisin-like protease [Auriscalpium vulgare]
MKVLGALVPLALAGYTLAVIPISSIRKSTLSIVPHKFIVEVDTTADIPGKRSTDAPHAHILRSLTERGVSYKVGHEYNSPGVFVGATITLENANDVKQLEQTAGIQAIRPVVLLPRAQPVSSHVLTGYGDSAAPPDSESTHKMTGVDKLHAQGYLGAGVKIGIIDTGIDYTHPALGGGFGPGHKVVGGWDFVGDAYTGTNTPVPDSDPLDQCAGHGTHVAGIIGADPGNEWNISGVAYKAAISAYRVFGCPEEGTVSDDIIIAALLRGHAEKQDILTLSLGGSAGWVEGSSAVVASRIAATGTIVTIAAGNDGAHGSWYSSSPGNGIDVISVASVDNTVIAIQNLTLHGADRDSLPYFRLQPAPFPDPLPLYATSNDSTVASDACDPLPDSTPDLSKYVTLVRRGSCAFTQKLGNIAAKGGNAVLIYNNVPGWASISTGIYTNASLIQDTDGAYLVSLVASGANVTIAFPQTGGSYDFPDPHGGLVSDYSSYGPSNDMYFKPAVAAPGGNILSTWPVPLGKYAVLSGTSMATPFVAGSAALVLNAKGKGVTSLSARTLFETTAQPVAADTTDAALLHTATQQGAGLINVYTAIHTETIVSPGELILNDTAHYQSSHSFTVHNTGKKVKQYTLTHVPAGTAQTLQTGTIFASLGPVPATSDHATVQLTTTKLTLQPGQSHVVGVHITPPKGGDPKVFPVHSGFITITSPTETTHVSYLGLKGSLKDAQVIDNTATLFPVAPPFILNATGDVQDAPTNYTFVGDDVPSWLVRLAFGTPLLRFDLVKPDIKFTPTLGHRALEERTPVVDRSWYSFPHGKANTFGQVSIVGPLFEFDYLPRDAEDGYTNTPFTPQFANGTNVPSGNYRVLVRALKPTGDITQEKDFESWLSPIVGFWPNATAAH